MAYALKMVELQSKWDNKAATQWAERAAGLQESYRMSDAEYEETCGTLMGKDTSFITAAQKRQQELK